VRRWFITGTDTGIGKTRAACALIRYLAGRGQSVAALKPVASGCEPTAQGLRNEDAVAMMEAMNVELAYEQVNPFAYKPAIAPHIAAEEAGRPVDLEKIAGVANAIRADHLVIEGAGGWCVPLDDKTLFSDLVRALEAEVILVVGIKLGCINHALLSAGQILRDGHGLTGWIANHIDPGMSATAKNMETLSKLMPAPLLGEIARDSTKLCIKNEYFGDR
jgi:dethiobiotin synthetase